MDTLIHDASLQTPDPERSRKNLGRLLATHPHVIEAHADSIQAIARLFAYSQFLADYAVKNPRYLTEALDSIGEPIERDAILREASSAGLTEVTAQPQALKQGAMRLLRDTKLRYLLRATLRDLTGATSFEQCMAELSVLAGAVTQIALDASFALVAKRFGELRDSEFSIIALGKLGAGELNYSSDIDIMTVYEASEGLSTGSESASGMIVNQIEPHEYFCRLTETLAALLQTQTEDGFAYRVDLRLRPDGRKGQLSLPVSSYVAYYEAWGKTWERMALIRARPIAGDLALGERLVESIEPFMWRRSSDFYEIEEIRELKKKIDTVFDANDVKRGYGGIREIEFFVQTFQLLYGGDRPNVRSGKLGEALAGLRREGLLLDEDVRTLSQSYEFLRRLEHVLQMKDDVQTHTLPARQEETALLARKLGFPGEREFGSELKLKRLMVHDMYDSLLGAPEGRQQEALVFLEDELADSEIRDYLVFKGFKDAATALNNIKALNEQISIGKTTRERMLLRKTVPMFLEEIFRSGNKDRALGMVVTLIEKLGFHESYMDLFSKRRDTISIIVDTFSESTYLTRSVLSLDNLESIFEYPDVRVDFASVRERLLRMLEYSRDPMSSVREFKLIEELRAGLLFLNGALGVDGLSSKLSMLAATIVRAALRYLGGEPGFAVIAMGKFGAAELNIGSDLDLVFVSGKDLSSRKAEELIGFLSKYTSRGIVYEVDARLRPDGTKGILVNDIDGYRNYYMKVAKVWEVQALLRARPIGGDKQSVRAFSRLKREVILARGDEVTGGAVREMRSRIVAELARESQGYDLKLGPGGIEEIEFLIQYLQLKNARQYPDLITHKTTTALRRLTAHGILDRGSASTLIYAYEFLRAVDTLLRFNEERVLKPSSGLAETIARFFELGSPGELADEVEKTRSKVRALAERLCR